jgi:histone deacetylase 1/2
MIAPISCGLFLYGLNLTLSTLSQFFAYARTQFGTSIKAVQCDNGREFDNSSSRTFFLTHGVQLRMSCPYTSAQNGKAERIIRSTNNMIRSLLFQASIPPAYWAEALHTATHLLNILPTKTLRFSTPHFALFGTAPVYDHLRTFGCACYPNLSATASHKLAPRSALCVFLGVLHSPQRVPVSRSFQQSDHHLSSCHIRRVHVPLCCNPHTTGNH